MNSRSSTQAAQTRTSRHSAALFATSVRESDASDECHSQDCADSDSLEELLSDVGSVVDWGGTDGRVGNNRQGRGRSYLAANMGLMRIVPLIVLLILLGDTVSEWQRCDGYAL
jgi:hypothetical protein